jgi:hypothetical protein
MKPINDPPSNDGPYKGPTYALWRCNNKTKRWGLWNVYTNLDKAIQDAMPFKKNHAVMIIQRTMASEIFP